VQRAAERRRVHVGGTSFTATGNRLGEADTMTKTLWQLPVPSTELIDGGPTFEKRAGREIALRMSYETDDGARTVALVFPDVEALAVTYDRARGDWMLEAYDQLVDRGQTPWLDEIIGNLRQHGADATGLAHLMINFDDSNDVYQQMSGIQSISPIDAYLHTNSTDKLLPTRTKLKARALYMKMSNDS